MVAPGRFDAITHALGNRNYRIYTIGNIASHFGMWAYRIALQWLTWKLTGSAFWLGVMAAADLLPTVFLAPLAGAITERINRLGLMRFSIAFTTVQSLALAALCLWGEVTIWAVFGLTLSLGLVLAFNHPNRLVIVPNMVDRDALASAVAINGLIFNIARVAGPSIAGGIIAAAGNTGAAAILGAGAVFAFNAGGNAIFVIALFCVRLRADYRSAIPQPIRKIPSEIRAGFAYAVNHDGLGKLLFLLLITALFGRTYIDLFSGFVDRVFGLEADALGLLMASVGLGAISAGFWLAQRGRVEGLTTIVLNAVLVLGISLIVFATAVNFYLALAAVFVAGAAMTIAGTGEHTLIQAAVSEDMRGRVVSLYGAISRGCPSLGAMIMGAVGDAVGLRWPVAAGAVICLLLWGWAWLQRKSLAASLETSPPDRVD